MADFKEYLMIIIVVCLMFHFTGLLSETGTINSYLLDTLTNPETFKSGWFYVSIFALIGTMALASSGTIVFGVVNAPAEVLYWAGIFYIFGSLGWDLIGIYTVLAAVNIPFATICISPLLIMYIISIVEWLRGI